MIISIIALIVPDAYEIIQSDSCFAHNLTILKDMEECEFAAQKLGIQIQEVQLESCDENLQGNCVSQDYETISRPHGCVYKSGEWKSVYWYSPVDSGYDDAPCGSVIEDEGYACICSMSGNVFSAGLTSFIQSTPSYQGFVLFVF